MALFYTLKYISEFFGDVRDTFLDMAADFAGVYILGDYLAPFMSTLSAYFGYVSYRFMDAAYDWLDAWNELKSNANIPYLLRQLENYAEDLIGFITDSDDWILTSIRNAFYRGYRLLQDPIGEVIDIILAYTGFDYDFVFNPFYVITGWINAAMGALIQLRDNPFSWLQDKINTLYPQVVSFLRDPDGWVLMKMKQLFPTLDLFLRDPDAFIVERFVLFLERFADRYAQRLLKIAERIILLFY